MSRSAIRTSLLALVLFAPDLAAAEEPVDYLGEIRPLFATYCYPCHGQWDISCEANLRLDKAEFAFADLADAGADRLCAARARTSKSLPKEVATDDA